MGGHVNSVLSQSGSGFIGLLVSPVQVKACHVCVWTVNCILVALCYVLVESGACEISIGFGLF